MLAKLWAEEAVAAAGKTVGPGVARVGCSGGGKVRGVGEFEKHGSLSMKTAVMYFDRTR